jgi:uncharacterized repeat protein (TIGR02543 family)
LAAKASYAVIAVSRYSGVDAVNPLGNVFSGNTNGMNGACSGGSDNKVYSFNLATTTNGAMVYGAAAMRDRSHTPGAGYTERAEIKKSSASVAVQDKSVATAGTAILNGTFSGSADWAVIGLEIKSSSGGVVTQYELTTNVVGSGSVNPSSGTYNAGAMVTLTATPDAGHQFSGWSGDLTGSTNPATITMNANKNITATFTALPPTQYSLTVTVAGSGSVNPSNGSYNADASVTLTATPNSGYQFSGWSGDLTGATNPATITMNANKNINATFIPQGGTGSGQIVYQETQTGASSSSTTVTTSTNLTASHGDLYLAAIVSRSKRAVSSVSGLGLTWTLVKAQCSGRNLTGVEVWMARGMPASNGTVTATFASAPSNAVIAVSRYSGVDATTPLGNIISGNTLGLNGACSGGSDNAAYSFNLTTTANGAVIYGAAATRSTTHTPGTGYTERVEIVQGSSSPATVAVQEKAVATAGTAALNGTFGSSNDWATVGIEIKPQLNMSKRSEFAANEEIANNQLSVTSYQLGQNYPNPFSANGTFGNPSTTINFSLPKTSQVRLNIYNETGQLVRTLIDGEMAAGRHGIYWNGKNQSGSSMASGVYLYQLVARGQNGEAAFTQTKRMTVLK